MSKFTPKSGWAEGSTPQQDQGVSLGGFVNNIGSNISKDVSGAANLFQMGMKSNPTTSAVMDLIGGKSLGTSSQEGQQQALQIGKGLVKQGVDAAALAAKNMPVSSALMDLAQHKQLGSNLKEGTQQGTDIVKKAPMWAYKNPVDLAMLLAPALGKGASLAGEAAGESGALAGEAAADELSPIGKTDFNPEGVGFKADTAQNIVRTKLPGDRIGVVSAEKNISKDVMDAAGGFTKSGTAKNIEKVYEKINDSLKNIVENKSSEVGPIPVNPSGGTGIMEEITNGLEGKFTKKYADQILEAKRHVEELLKPENIGTQDATQYTTLEKMNEARKSINSSLESWIQRGQPLVTENDFYNASLSHIGHKIGEVLSDLSPEAKELVNTQARFIPGYGGLRRQLSAVSGNGRVMGKFGVISKGVGAITNPLKTIATVEPNSEFAQRLSQLIGEPVPSQVGNIAKIRNASNVLKGINPSILPGLQTLLQQGQEPVK